MKSYRSHLCLKNKENRVYTTNFSLRRVQLYYETCVYKQDSAARFTRLSPAWNRSIEKSRCDWLKLPAKIRVVIWRVCLAWQAGLEIPFTEWTITITRDHQFVCAVGIILLCPFYWKKCSLRLLLLFPLESITVHFSKRDAHFVSMNVGNMIITGIFAWFLICLQGFYCACMRLIVISCKVIHPLPRNS